MIKSNRLKYYFNRINEASLISIIQILIIKLKKKVFLFYYSPFLYLNFFKPKKKNLSFIKSNSFGEEFEKLFRVNVPVFDNVIFDKKLYDLIKTNKFTCLGYGIGNIPKGKEWHQDQFHNFEWCQDYFDKIDFVTIDKYCDVKVPWEYSRLQFLMFFALDFIQNDKKEYIIIENYKKILLNWISANPIGFGVNWICNMEVSIRAVNMSISYLLLKKYLTKEVRKTIELSLLEHNQFINSFPELSDVPGNHYLSNLMGSYLSSFVIYGKESKPAKKYLKKFIIEGEKEFLPGGCHFEMATVYHRLCLDFVGIILALSYESNSVNEKIFNKPLLDIYKKGIDFCYSISSDNILSMFGDFDSGHVVWLGNDDRNFEYLSQFYSIIKRGFFYGGNNSQTLFLSTLAGLKAVKREKLILKEAKVFNQSGFISSQKGSLTSVIRVGPQGLKGRASHDHDDALSIWLSYKGKDILVDEGCNSYSLDKIVREKCIISSGHNVHKIHQKERFVPVLGSIVNTVRGASVSNCNSSKMIDDVCHLEASLNIDLNSDFIVSKRMLELHDVNGGKLCIVNDLWKLKEKSKTEVKWRFDTNEEPTFLLNDINEKRILINLKYFKCIVEIKATTSFNVDVFDFDFSSKYGFSKKCYGLHVIYNGAVKGNSQTKFYINDN